MKNWKQWVGKLAAWVVVAGTAFAKEVLGLDITWLPTACALFLGVVQLVISLIPDKE